ncbi:MAG: isoleucine--tRNA ligase [Candidatus Micrarchaeota archaeon]
MYKPDEVELEIKKFWEDKAIYRKAKKKNEKGEHFYFCDGPPYATGQIHPGTAWNKCLKDAVCRYKRFKGYNVRARPGYDTHGLPIEVKVEQELNLKSKKEIAKIGIPEFISRCKKFATQYIDIMSKQFEGLGVWMDWDSPYITFKNSYVESSWATIKKAHAKGLLQRGVYVLPQCPRCETTIANYELEYDDRDDPSIYVKFKVKGKANEYLVIWTTTPWTLLANMAVMVHPGYQYVRAKVDGEVWIVAKERLDALMAVTHNLDLSAVVLEELPGKKLDGIRYENPLAQFIKKDFDRRIVLNEQFVSLEDGTGLVHCAPGHGPQDFIVGKQYDIEPFCPVNEQGNYTLDAGKFAGMNVKKADPLILEDLKTAGALIHSGKIRHRYPHCWRCKTPLIFITTDQWFISISKLKERMLEEIDTVFWQPGFACTWFKDFVGSAPDWCISRQRYWGIPLPIWTCEKCGELKVIGSAEELGKKLPDLHKPFIDEVEFECHKCKGTMKRTPDVLDVWFDSGNAVWASLDPDEHMIQTDFIVEGKDQIRGWFYSLLGSGVVLNEKIPYKALLMHGHFVDEKGEKMSKSLGNFVPLEEMQGKYGRDAFRLWSLSSTIWDDVRFNWDDLREASKALSIMWNLGLFMGKFYEKPKKPIYEPEDRWLISRTNSLARDCEKAYSEYRIHDAVRACRDFIVEDVSRFYLKVAKKRIVEEKNPEGASDALYNGILTAIKLLNPAAPFITEKLYQDVFKEYEGAESISLSDWPKVSASGIDSLLERQMSIAREVISAGANARQSADIKLRWPLEELVIVTQSTEAREAIEQLSKIIQESSNVKRVRTEQDIEKSAKAKPVISKLGPAFKKDAKEAQELIAALKGIEIKELLSKGTLELKGTKKFSITPDMVQIIEEPPPGYALSQFSAGAVYIKTEVNPALYEEAMAREVGRRIQIMRKELALVETDNIQVNVIAGEEFLKLLSNRKDEIALSVNASEVILSDVPKMSGAPQEWDIEAEAVKIIIAKDKTAKEKKK